VTVISGVGEGLTTLSGFVYGVSGPIRLQLRKEGYLNGAPQLEVSEHRNADFDITAERPRKDYSGIYTLTISATACLFSKGVLPEDAKRRVYTATVTQDGGRATVTLTDADFIVTSGRGNRFFGFIEPNDSTTFTLGGDYYYQLEYDVVERFGATALLINGQVSATGSPERLSGTLNGSIEIATRATPPFTSINHSCYARTHGFEMVRR